MKHLFRHPTVLALVMVLVTSLLLAAEPTHNAQPTHSAAPTEQTGKSFTVYPIGKVDRVGDRTVIVIDGKYQDGLLGLDQWSHVQVIWWFDRNDTPQRRAILQVHPRGDKSNPLTGVFACRAPVRPNLIALTLCKIVSVKDNIIEVENIDALPGTPVLDLKPYAPGQDSVQKAKVPAWAGPSKQSP